MTQKLLFFAVFLLPLFSCNESKQGITMPVAYVNIRATDSAGIKDTLLKVVRYRQDGTFTQPIDSVQQSYYNSGSAPLQLMIRIDTSNQTNYNFDLLARFYPSGKTYRVTSLTHNQTSCKHSTICKKLVTCYNDIQFTVNGNRSFSNGEYGMMELDY